MRWVRVGTIDLLECADCDATWIEAVTFERLCADRESQATVLHANAAAPALGKGARIERIQYRPCLKYGRLMNRVNFGLLSGTIVDVCKGHGTFLNRGELHQVIQFILDGGLERTREAKRQGLIEEEHRLHEVLSALLDRSR